MNHKNRFFTTIHHQSVDRITDFYLKANEIFYEWPSHESILLYISPANIEVMFNALKR